MKIAFYTLGCKVNQYETQALEQLVTQRGHSLVPFEEAADAYVINTCTVTAVSDKKSRQVIRRARKAAPDAVIAVCGCYPQTHPDDVEKLGVDLIAGTGDRTGFVDLLEREWRDRQPITALDDAFQRRTFEPLPAGGLEGRTRAMLKMEDGCVNFCSYCIIPYARGRVRSLPLEDCVRQAQALEAAGYREIVLTGIEISSWGQDLEGKPELIEAIEAICQGLSPDTRVRLGSLEPRTITPDFCRRAAALPNLCPHFHLSMQSGCDTVLARMNRKYDSNRYYESVKFLHEVYDRPAITTDLIVGFPGETEEEFGETLEFIRRCAFASMHVFPYSRRPGTVADTLPGQLTHAVKNERAHAAHEVAAQMQREYLEQCVGSEQAVLFETEEDGWSFGHAPNYAEVKVEGTKLRGLVKLVKIRSISGQMLVGAAIDSDEGKKI